MPTYAYACPKCGHEYEKLQKFSDKTRAKCPECGTRGERLISGGAGLVFKGSGFYITDYKRSGEPKDGVEGQKPSKASDDAKPDTATPVEKSTGSPSSDKGKGAES